MQTTFDDDDVVPYFLMPSLGGGSVLRGTPRDGSAIGTPSSRAPSGAGSRTAPPSTWLSSSTPAPSRRTVRISGRSACRPTGASAAASTGPPRRPCGSRSRTAPTDGSWWCRASPPSDRPMTRDLAHHAVFSHGRRRPRAGGVRHRPARHARAGVGLESPLLRRRPARRLNPRRRTRLRCRIATSISSATSC